MFDDANFIMVFEAVLFTCIVIELLFLTLICSWGLVECCSGSLQSGQTDGPTNGGEDRGYECRISPRLPEETEQETGEIPIRDQVSADRNEDHSYEEPIRRVVPLQDGNNHGAIGGRDQTVDVSLGDQPSNYSNSESSPAFLMDRSTELIYQDSVGVVNVPQHDYEISFCGPYQNLGLQEPEVTGIEATSVHAGEESIIGTINRGIPLQDESEDALSTQNWEEPDIGSILMRRVMENFGRIPDQNEEARDAHSFEELDLRELLRLAVLKN